MKSPSALAPMSIYPTIAAQAANNQPQIGLAITDEVAALIEGAGVKLHRSRGQVRSETVPLPESE